MTKHNTPARYILIDTLGRSGLGAGVTFVYTPTTLLKHAIIEANAELTEKEIHEEIDRITSRHEP